MDGEPYYLPLAISDEVTDGDAIVRLGSRAIVDGHVDPAFARRLLDAIAAGREIPGQRGRFVCRPMSPWAGPGPGEMATLHVRRLSGEQSNTSIAIGRTLILKSLRRPRRGINPEVEITEFLNRRTRFRHVPPLLGWMDYAPPTGETAIVSVLQGFVDNTGDGWRHVCLALGRAVDSLASVPAGAPETERPNRDDHLIREMHELGTVTGGLHAALASAPGLPAFAPEPVTIDDSRRWGSAIGAALGRLASAATGDPRIARALGDAMRAGDGIGRIQGALDRLAAAGTHKIRCHGDYHLGQVLKTEKSFVVIDFEGEPSRPIEERRAKQSPLRDVAGMLRSFNYAVHSVLRERAPAEHARAAAWLESWERLARDAFLDGYAEAVARSPVRLVPPSRDDLVRACEPFEVDKGCYELTYELDNRPDWVAIPLAGLSRLLAPSR